MAGRRIFIDTGAFVALFDKGDDFHVAATEQWALLQKEKASLVTSNYVVDETITTIRSFAGHAIAVRAGEALFESRLLHRIPIDERVEVDAWSLFRKDDDQDFSFTDCTSFALMRTEKIDTAFCFDADFTIAGFATLPGT